MSFEWFVLSKIAVFQNTQQSSFRVNAEILYIMIAQLYMCILSSITLFIEKEIKCSLAPSANSYSLDGVI